MIKRLIIAGIGSVGTHLVRYLQTHYEIIAIDHCPEVIQEIQNKYDIQGIVGDLLDFSVLRKLALGPQCGFISVTGSDSINLTVCQFIKQFFTIGFLAVRLHNAQLHEETLAKGLKEALGINVILDLESYVAHTAFHAAHYPGVMRHFSCCDKKLEGVMVKITPKHRLCGMKIEDVEQHHIPQAIRIVRVMRGQKIHTHHQNIILQEDDVVCLVYQPTVALKRLLDTTVYFPENILYLGGGLCADSVARLLTHTYAGKIFFLDTQKALFESLILTYPECTFLTLCPFTSDLWYELPCTPQNTVLLALGHSDADNILAGLAHNHARHVVTLVRDAAYLTMSTLLGVRAVIHPALLLVEQLMEELSPYFVQHIHVLPLTTSYQGEELLLFMTVIVKKGAPLLRIQHSDITDPAVDIIAVLRKKKLIFNPKNFMEDDRIVVSCTQFYYNQFLELLTPKSG
jgi:Trk K+ transport system NAD-binding subunit